MIAIRIKCFKGSYYPHLLNNYLINYSNFSGLTYPPFKLRILLSQHLHFISVALLEVSELMLHFGLPFQGGSQVQLVCHNLLRPCFQLLWDTSSATCWNHLHRFSNCFGKILTRAPRWAPIVSVETITKYQWAQIMSYPIFDFLRWVLLGYVAYVFLQCCQIGCFWSYLWKRLWQSSQWELSKVKSHIRELMNCVPLII